MTPFTSVPSHFTGFPHLPHSAQPSASAHNLFGRTFSIDPFAQATAPPVSPSPSPPSSPVVPSSNLVEQPHDAMLPPSAHDYHHHHHGQQGQHLVQQQQHQHQPYYAHAPNPAPAQPQWNSPPSPSHHQHHGYYQNTGGHSPPSKQTPPPPPPYDHQQQQQQQSPPVQQPQYHYPHPHQTSPQTEFANHAQIYPVPSNEAENINANIPGVSPLPHNPGAATSSMSSPSHNPHYHHHTASPNQHQHQFQYAMSQQPQQQNMASTYFYSHGNTSSVAPFHHQQHDSVLRIVQAPIPSTSMMGSSATPVRHPPQQGHAGQDGGPKPTSWTPVRPAFSGHAQAHGYAVPSQQTQSQVAPGSKPPPLGYPTSGKQTYPSQRQKLGPAPSSGRYHSQPHEQQWSPYYPSAGGR